MTRAQRQRIAARVLAAGGDDAAAGAACGRSARSVRLWRGTSEDFAEMVEDARRADERVERMRADVAVALGGGYDALRRDPYVGRPDPMPDDSNMIATRA